MQRQLKTAFLVLLVMSYAASPTAARSVRRGFEKPAPKTKASKEASAVPVLKGKVTRTGVGGVSSNRLQVSVRLQATGVRVDGSARRSHSLSHVCVASTYVPNVMLVRWEAWEPDGGVDAEGRPTKVLRAYERVNVACQDGAYEVTRCVNNCPPGTPPPPPPPDPYELFLVLADSIAFHVPQPTLSPDLDRANSRVLVGMPFFWSVPEVQFETLRLEGTGCNGAACTSVWVEARPQYLYFTPGDGNETVRTCRRTGDIVRSKAQADAAPTDCTYTYDVAGDHTAAVGIRYLVTGGQLGGGTFPVQFQDSEVEIAVPVWEYQPVIIG